jgi:hypothetical protein
MNTITDTDEREQRRQRTLALPIETASSAEAWQTSFEALERIREKAAYLTDDEMDALVTETLAHVHDFTPEAAL